MSLEILKYDDSLKESLFRFTDSCFTEIGKSFEPQGRHSFYNDIPVSFDLFLCLAEDGNVMGSAGIKEIDNDTCELKALYLADELRGMGWGYKLLDSVVEFARGAGYKRVVLDSMSKYKDARRLYVRYGFKETCRYNDNQYADVFMEYKL